MARCVWCLCKVLGHFFCPSGGGQEEKYLQKRWFFGWFLDKKVILQGLLAPPISQGNFWLWQDVSVVRRGGCRVYILKGGGQKYMNYLQNK